MELPAFHVENWDWKQYAESGLFDVDKKGNIYVLDEPTTGLRAFDIKSIMQLLERFVKRGNTVIVIEHNQDVMKQADYLIYEIGLTIFRCI